MPLCRGKPMACCKPIIVLDTRAPPCLPPGITVPLDSLRAGTFSSSLQDVRYRRRQRKRCITVAVFSSMKSSCNFSQLYRRMGQVRGQSSAQRWGGGPSPLGDNRNRGRPSCYTERNERNLCPRPRQGTSDAERVWAPAGTKWLNLPDHTHTM